jgi:hypothetical protein
MPLTHVIIGAVLRIQSVVMHKVAVPRGITHSGSCDGVFKRMCSWQYSDPIKLIGMADSL